MPNIYAIKARIKSVESTRQVTKSMKMVSTAKLRRTQYTMNRVQPFAEHCRRILECLCSGGLETEQALMQARTEIKRVCYVLIVGNRGLCGSYNSDILRYMKELAKREEKEFFTVVCGHWGEDVIAQEGLNVKRRFPELSDTPDRGESGRISDYLKELYRSGQADKIVLVYQRHKGMGQEAVNEQLLPVVPLKGVKARDYIFEPDRESLLERVADLYVDNVVYEALLQARTGEHFARMTAMTTATDNTDEIIRKLTQEMNTQRQAQITTQISEVIGGANALSQDKARR
ncbi:MAG: ATP synthase F1 subunit gamma [Candidatus Limivicinus sp.]|nr:ATP synthase F1 subunit gamma [Candidatus Limivicinus sp.]